MSRLLRLRKFVDNRLGRSAFLKQILRPAYYAAQKVRYADLVRPNVALKDAYRGGRLFILCTGSAVDEIDFSLLRGKAVLGIAFLVKHPRFHELTPTFYADLEPIHSVMNRQTMIELFGPPDGVVLAPHNVETVIADYYSLSSEFGGASVIDQAPYLFYRAIDQACRDPHTRFFLNAGSKSFFERHGLFKGRKVSWIMKAAPPIPVAQRQSCDLAAAPTFVDGSLYFAVAAGIYMGFREIVLVGAGYTYAPLQEFHFYDLPILSAEYSEREARALLDRLAKSIGTRVRSVERLDRGYRPVLVRDLPPDPRHRLLKEFAHAHGVNIYNLVPEGFTSPIYPAVTRAFVEEEWLRAPAMELPHVH